MSDGAPRVGARRSGLTRRLFGGLNAVVEPLVRRGLASPVAGPGLVVLETTGRRTGERRRVPLVAVRVGSSIVVSTLRAESAWLRNLESDGRARVWSAGRARPVTGSVQRLRTGGCAHLRADPWPSRRSARRSIRRGEQRTAVPAE